MCTRATLDNSSVGEGGQTPDVHSATAQCNRQEQWHDPCGLPHQRVPVRWGLGQSGVAPNLLLPPPVPALDLAFVTVHWRWTVRRDGNSRAALHRHRAFLQGTTASKLQDALPKAIRCACPVTQGVGRTRVGAAARAAHDNVCGHGPDPPCTVWGLSCPSVVPLFDDVPL